MKISKIQTAFACVFTVVAIAGGVAYKNAEDYKVKAAKIEAERIAYANRPIVEDYCFMNGYGNVNCKFTNIGKTAGAQCGYINVIGPSVTKSELFCSGLVQPSTTIKVELEIPAVHELCESSSGKDWWDVCSHAFIKDSFIKK